MAYSKEDLIESRTAETKSADNTVSPSLAQAVSLAKVVSTEATARAWRVTLARVNRVDQHALNTGIFPSELLLRFPGYAYAAGFIFPPGTVPPRRSNPIWGTNTGSVGGPNVVTPLFVQISFGMPGAQPNRILANWPMMGGSVVVEGSFVEVFGGVRIVSNGSIDPGAFPLFQATITPIDGLASQDAGELSLCQYAFLENESATPLVSGIDTNGVTDRPGFLVALAGNAPGALGIGAVFAVPTDGWTAHLGSINGATYAMVIYISDEGPPTFELRDGQVPDATGAWIASPGNVGIVYKTDAGAAPMQVGDLEALINTSGIAIVATPDPNPGFFINDLWATDLTYAGMVSGLGVAEALGATGGAAVYVPEFARRVMVTLGNTNQQFINEDLRVPITGPIPCQLVWYDDQGGTVFVEYQGPVAAPNTGVEPTIWRPVPARAVMLGIYGPPDAAPPAIIATIHWRIAP